MTLAAEAEGDTEPTIVDLTAEATERGSPPSEPSKPPIGKGLGLAGAALLILVIALVAFDGGSRPLPPPDVTPDASQSEPTVSPSAASAIEGVRGALGFSDMLALVRQARASGDLPEAYVTGSPPSVSALPEGARLCSHLHLAPGGVFEGTLWFDVAEGGAVTTWAGSPGLDQRLAEDLLTSSIGGTGLATVGEGVLTQPLDTTYTSLAFWQLSTGAIPIPGAGPNARFLSASQDLVAFENRGKVVIVDVALDQVSSVYSPANPRAQIVSASLSPSASMVAILDSFGTVSVLEVPGLDLVYSTPTRAADVAWLSETTIGVVRATLYGFALTSVDVFDKTEFETHRLESGSPWHMTRVGGSC